MKRLALLLLCSLLSVALFAEDAELGYRAGNVSNFQLYPEGNFYAFPSQLGTLGEDILQLRPELRFTNFDADVTTDLATNGTLTNRSPGGANPSVTIGLAGLYATGFDDLTIAADLAFDYSSVTFTDLTDSSYSTAGETVTTIDRDIYFDIAPQVYMSLPLSDFTLGFGGTFTTRIDPVEEEFTRVTDTAANNGEEYITTGSVFSTSGFDTSLVASVSGTADAAIWAARAAGLLGLTSNQDYYAIDTDTDGFDETVVDQVTWGTTPGGQGGAGNAFYDFTEESTELLAILSGFYKMPMGDASLILSGAWVPVNSTTELTYERFAETEQNEETRVIDAGLLNAGLSVAYDFMLGSNINVRAGSGVNFSVVRTTQQELDNAGVTAFDVSNTNRYNEVNYAADPDNGEVITDGAIGTPWGLGFSADRASSELTVTLPIDVEARIYPSNNVTLFSGFQGGVIYEADTYNVFNTADNTVWTEQRTSFSFDLNSSLLTGVEFGLADGLTVIMATDVFPFSTGIRSSNDQLPNQSGTDTTSTAVDTVDTTDADFIFDITVTFRY